MVVLGAGVRLPVGHLARASGKALGSETEAGSALEQAFSLGEEWPPPHLSIKQQLRPRRGGVE